MFGTRNRVFYTRRRVFGTRHRVFYTRHRVFEPRRRVFEPGKFKKFVLIFESHAAPHSTKLYCGDLFLRLFSDIFWLWVTVFV